MTRNLRYNNFAHILKIKALLQKYVTKIKNL